MSNLDPLEQSILNGTFFQGPRTPSPTRSASTGSNASSSSSSSSRSRSPSPTGMPSGAPLRTTGPQTGPKGVRADRDHARQVGREQRRAERRERERELRGRAVVAGDWRVQERLQAVADKQRREGRSGTKEENKREELDLDEPELQDDDDDDEDEEALQRYRRARKLELQGGQQASSSSSSSSSSRPLATAATTATATQYGHLIEVDGDSYASQIDDVPAGTSVVVHIYSELSPTCTSLTTSLTTLSTHHPTTKFLQVPAWEIGFGVTSPCEDIEEMERDAAAVTPTLLIYRDGKLVANLVRVDLLTKEEGGVGGGAEERDVLRTLRLFGAV